MGLCYAEPVVMFVERATGRRLIYGEVTPQQVPAILAAGIDGVASGTRTLERNWYYPEFEEPAPGELQARIVLRNTGRQFAAIQYAVDTVHKRGLRIDGGLERIFVAGAYPQQIRCLARSPAFSQKGGVTLSRQAVCPKHRIIFGLPDEEQRIHQHNILWIIQISKN